MKETYFVGFDPVSKLWDAQPITPDFPEECWVYKVIARNGHEALVAGLAKHQALVAELSPTELRVAQAIVRQVNRIDRNPNDILMIDIPQKSLAGAQTLANRGFFTLAHQEEALIQISSAGWKAMAGHIEKQRLLDDECDFALRA